MKYLLAVLASVIGTTGVRAAEIHSVLAHPVFGEGYACVEHGADA